MTAAYHLGPYRLLAELGHGGMADVYLAAVQGPLGMGFTKLAVVKKLRSSIADDPEFVTMLMDEARLTARLSHPNVVQLFDVGKDGDTYFLAMEFLEGQPLYRIEQRAQKLGVAFPLELDCAIISDLLAGVHYAHELADYDGSPLHVVHRDLTPHNVFVTYAGVVKVMDFGIAKATGRTHETQQGVVKGKYPYMSPEQVLGGAVDRRTDIFAAGVLLYNACAPRKLWAGLSDGEIVQRLVSGAYEASPNARGANVPPALDAICRKALAQRADDRYATAAEMRADLEAFLGQESVAARRKLEVTMKELFGSERAKLKQVLEASRLTGTTADAGALAAAAARAMLDGVAISDAPAPSSRKPPRTRDAAGREPGAAVTLSPPTSSGRPPTTTVRPKRPASPAELDRVGRATPTRAGRRALASAIALLITAGLAVGLHRVRPGLFLAHGSPRTDSQRHAVARTDVTPLWPIARSKVGAEEEEPAAAARRELLDPKATAATGTVPVAPAPSDAPPSPSPSPFPEPPAKKLDENPPW